MSQRWSWTGMVLFAGGLFLFQIGCAEQKPKPSGKTSVDPATLMTPKPGVPATTATTPEKTGGASSSTPAEKEAPTDEEATPKTPADAGSTTGGGIELPSTPGEGA